MWRAGRRHNGFLSMRPAWTGMTRAGSTFSTAVSYGSPLLGRRIGVHLDDASGARPRWIDVERGSRTVDREGELAEHGDAVRRGHVVGTEREPDQRAQIHRGSHFPVED